MIQIQREPDMSVEPGHQVLLIDADAMGCSLARLLAGEDCSKYLQPSNPGFCHVFHIPHDTAVDDRIVALIDLLADIRYQAPQLMQLTLVESVQPLLKIIPRKDS